MKNLRPTRFPPLFPQQRTAAAIPVEDLMEMLLLSRPTVYRLLKQNEFRWFKVSGAYRISKASFEAWLNDGTVERNPAV